MKKALSNFWHSYLVRRAARRERIKFLKNDPYGYQLRQIDTTLMGIYMMAIAILMISALAFFGDRPLGVSVTNYPVDYQSPLYNSVPYPAPRSK